MVARESYHIQLMSHYKHMSLGRLSCATENLSYIIGKFAKSVIEVDSNFPFTDTG